MKEILMPLRGLKRWAEYLAQIRADLNWHRRFSGPEMPARGRRIAEQARLLVRCGIDGEDYYNHGLFRPDISFEEKRKFLGYYKKSRYFDLINPPVYDILARDKVLFHMLATSLNLPVPELLAVTSSTGLPQYGQRLENAQALAEFLRQPGSENLFLKPGGSSFGEGALSIGNRLPGSDAWRRLPGEASIELEEILKHVERKGRMRRFLIQRRLIPHLVLGEIVPDVCPTVRIMTYVGSTTTVLGAALRLGSGTEPTDNLSGGGVVVSIDMATGKLGGVVNIDGSIPMRTTSHPVTGVEISGKTLPDWPAIIDLVTSAASKLSFIPCIGWDIGVTDKGPVIVEINTRPRCRPIQVANDRGILEGPFLEALLKNDGTANSGLNLRSDV